MTELKGEVNSTTTIVGDFNSSFEIMCRTIKRLSRETVNLNNTINEVDLTDIYRTVYLTIIAHIFLSAQRSFPKIDHILGHRLSLNRFRKIDNIQSYPL